MTTQEIVEKINHGLITGRKHNGIRCSLTESESTYV